MHTYRHRIGDAAASPGVSADTVRRLVGGRKTDRRPGRAGPRIIPGPALAACARRSHRVARGSTGSSARNRFPGVVTDVTLRDVSAQVGIQAGPFRVMSMVSRASAEDLRPVSNVVGP
ncbi:TOBE domain-containing protein [Streptomyces sp. bgisy034]|uniref:TOBE domain-containing protein n=1 Tax=Streptomyces sp. bgisy034 TaxID=3413774 RepID=UPI003EBB8F47